jgi:putative heme-binding domain-containing protein
MDPRSSHRLLLMLETREKGVKAWSRFFCSVVVAVTVLMVGGATFAADGAPSWIWGPHGRDVGARFQKRFDVPSGWDRAAVRLWVDSCDLKLQLNELPCGAVTVWEGALELELNRQLRAGSNTLTVHAEPTAGPAAFALELTLHAADQTNRVVHSDASWEVRPSDAPGEAATTRAVEHGSLAAESWWKATRPSVDLFDDYNQWKEARGSGDQSVAPTFHLLPGFEIEQIHEAAASEGSWVSLVTDPRGRFLIGKEGPGILRLTLPHGRGGKPQVELIDETLRECRGLLWAHDSLYANAHGSNALYRLRDTDGDDYFDDVERLHETVGTSSHGRNDLALASDGSIYIIHGEGIAIPEEFTSRLPRPPDAGEGGRPIGGHVIRTDPDGKAWEVVASGLRNPFGIDFNAEGELFTYDADAERDQGLPWYRPTRINHIVSGGDYGWRPGDAKWPAYYPDSLPSNLDVGKGSPTSVKFASKSRFPWPYHDALFVLDWAYGRILVIHLTPVGASYRGKAEDFLRGRPLNVTDLEFGPDGALYFVTGGRKTRSALYRVSFVGTPPKVPPTTAQQSAREAYARKARALRRELERFHAKGKPGAVDVAWMVLDHVDPWVQHAARTALEHQSTARWATRALEEPDADKALVALLALARSAAESSAERVVTRLAELQLPQMSSRGTRIATRILSLVSDRRPDILKHDTSLGEQLESLFPSGDRALDRELAGLLARADSRRVAAKTLSLVDHAPPQEDLFHFLTVLADVKSGWTHTLRKEYFRALAGARFFRGDERLQGLVGQLFQQAVAALPDVERESLASLLALSEKETSRAEDPSPTAGNRSFVKRWTVDDFGSEEKEAPRDMDVGSRVYREARCSNCHRLGSIGQAYGPDLTAVASRFHERDILRSVLEPSTVVAPKYRTHVIVKRDGSVVSGQVVRNEFRKGVLQLAADPQRLEELTAVAKKDIVSHQESTTSPMPEALLDSFSREEVLALVAFLVSGGR